MDLIIKENKVFIPLADSLKDNDSLAIRIFDKEKMVDYKSTRLGTIKDANAGKSFDCDDKFTGCEYELKNLSNGKLVKGKLVKDNKQVKEKEPDNKT